MESSVPAANITNEIMASRFSEVMWLMEQIMWKGVDKRLAKFLLEESAPEGANTLKLTHETIANHLGTTKEVVPGMLRYFQSEGMVKLPRGAVEITDAKKLEQLQNANRRIKTAILRSLSRRMAVLLNPNSRCVPGE